jgi:hypothetical protein
MGVIMASIDPELLKNFSLTEGADPSGRLSIIGLTESFAFRLTNQGFSV